MKILIIDDELVSRSKMNSLMRCFGICKAVDNGEEAIDLFKEAWRTGRPFDLVTLDINMPDIDGFEVLLALRDFERVLEVEKVRQSIIIMVTAQSDKQNVFTCLKAGCDDYIVKPFNIKLIREKLEKFGIDEINTV